VRLLTEFERGERHNVSLETALLLLCAVGISLEPRSVTTEKQERAERRAIRQATWTGVITTRTAMQKPPAPATIAARLAAVGKASVLAHALVGELKRADERKPTNVGGHAAAPTTKRARGRGRSSMRKQAEKIATKPAPK
jgi:hypothetical protein